MSDAPIRLKLKRKSEVIILEDEAGTERTYTLRELTGIDRDTYMTLINSKMNYVNGKAAGMKDTNGLQTGLLERSLYDESDKLVPRKTIDQFPATVVEALFDRAQVLSALVPAEEKKLGKI